MNIKKRLTSPLIAAIITLLNVHCVFGQEWEQVNVPDSVLSVGHIYCKGEKIYIATNFGIYFSNDNCNNWEYLGLEGYSVYAIILTENNELFSGGGSSVFKYLGDQQWELLHTNGGGGNVVCFHQSANGDIYESSWGGIYRSQDGGQTWERALETSYSEIIYDIDENSEGLLFAGSTSFINDPGGFYRSDDNGDTWNLVGLNYHFISSIEINSFDTIFIGTRGHYNTGGGRIFKSLDKDGNSWKLMYENNLVASMSINYDDVIAIGCAMFGMRYPGGVYKSYDNGISWIDISGNISTRYIYKVAFDSQNKLYAITYADFELYRSIDPINNHSFYQANDNLTFNVFPNPAKEFITFYLPDTEGQLLGRILNSKGDILHEFDLNQTVGAKKIYVDFLKKGIYFIIINNKREHHLSKFIKY